VPAAHGEQAEAEAAEYLPARQLVHVDVAVPAEYLPAAQGMQLTSPEARVIVYEPASQFLHEEKGDTEILPAAQAVQVVEEEVE